jgi:hypothetical protein
MGARKLKGAQAHLALERYQCALESHNRCGAKCPQVGKDIDGDGPLCSCGDYSSCGPCCRPLEHEGPHVFHTGCHYLDRCLCITNLWE